LIVMPGQPRQETDAMERARFLAAARQLAAAADLLASGGPADLQADALQMLAQFRGYERPEDGARGDVQTSDDELFASTAHAALTLVGRHEFAAAHALLQQAQRLLSS
jgi:hypothetical protein